MIGGTGTDGVPQSFGFVLSIPSWEVRKEGGLDLKKEEMVESRWLSTLLRSGFFATSCGAILMAIIFVVAVSVMSLEVMGKMNGGKEV